MNGTDEDAHQLRRIVERLYRSVSAPPGVRPPLEEGDALMHLAARKVRTTRDQEGHARFHIMSAEEYADNVRDYLTGIGFFEVEVAHESFVYGHIAHVISRYEAYEDEAHTHLVKRGVNSIQFLKTGEGWRVFSLIWDDELNVVPQLRHGTATSRSATAAPAASATTMR
jgi:hypothetical protein